MKIETLMKRISGLRCDFDIMEYNELNYSITFDINGHKCFADCDTGKNEVNFFGIEGKHDETRQETDRIFCDSFSQLIRRANREEK